MEHLVCLVGFSKNSKEFFGKTVMRVRTKKFKHMDVHLKKSFKYSKSICSIKCLSFKFDTRFRLNECTKQFLKLLEKHSINKRTTKIAHLNVSNT